jgi:dTDP-4-dehydrorhamnose 3,5-epimerase
MLEGVMVLEPRVFEDSRGYFLETYNKREMGECGITGEFVQDNLSCSVRNVLRGLHYQVEHPQGKLARAIMGSVYDVVVDLRISSPTLGKWVGAELSEQNRRSLWIPPGFAHGFLVLSEQAAFAYKTTDFYAPQFERTIIWNDPQLAIQWPLASMPIVSAKDRAGQRFEVAELFGQPAEAGSAYG